MARVYFCFRGKENMAVHGIRGKFWNQEGKFWDAASLLLVWLCTPARWHFLRLVPVVLWLYLTLTYGTSAFSLPLIHYSSSSKLQLLDYSSSA
jgi:hypothetical protein